MKALLLNLKENSPESDTTSKKFSINEIPFEIIERITPSIFFKDDSSDKEKNKVLELDLEKSLLKANEKNLVLIVNKFEPIQKNEKLLKILQNSEADFLFEDFPTLRRDNIDFLIKILKYQSKEKSKRIQEGLQKRKNKGEIIGNPKIGDKENIKKAIIAKQKNLIFNREHKLIREKIETLKEKAKLNFNQIAKSLNLDGISTPSGGKFYAKSVERLFQKQKEIIANFKENPKQSTLTEVMRVRNGDEIKLIDLNNDDQFTETINFQIKYPFPKGFKLIILDNKENEVYSEKFPQNQKEINIETTYFLPGLYYLKIEPKSKGQAPIYKSLYLYKDLLN